MSRHTENARKDFDRGVAALQKKRFEEAERNFVDLIQKYPDEKELVDRARVYRAVCERQKNSGNRALLEPEDFYYAAVIEKNRGNVSEAIDHLKRAARKNGGGRVDFLLACCYAQSGDSVTALEHLRRRSRRTSATASWPATTAISIRCATAPSSRSSCVSLRAARGIWAFGPPASGSAGCGLDRSPDPSPRASLPRRAPPPSVTSGDYARRDRGTLGMAS